MPVALFFNRRFLYSLLGIALVVGAFTFMVANWLQGQMKGPIWTADTQPVEVVINSRVFAIPANLIRFSEQRRNGNAKRVDLALLWPDGAGYSAENRTAFLNTTADRLLMFAHLQPSAQAQDMDGRLNSLYRPLFAGTSTQGPAGLQLQRLQEGRGYEGEELAIGGVADGQSLWVARCQIAKGTTVPTCLRDVNLDGGVSLTYRFPRALLENWRGIDALFLKTINGLSR